MRDCGGNEEIPGFKLRHAFASMALALFAGLPISSDWVMAQGAKVDCATATDQQDLNFCAAQEAQKANVEMESALDAARQWGRAMNLKKSDVVTDPVNVLDVLDLSQRGWVDYRDGQCMLSGLSARDALAGDMLASQCEAAMTRSRAEELQKLAKDNGE